MRVVPCDADGPRRLAAGRALLAPAFGPGRVAIQHVGSTSLPGLAAKPVVDTLAVVSALESADASTGALAVPAYPRARPAEAGRYGALKAALAARHPTDSEAYTEGKDALVKARQAAALAWRRAQPEGAGAAHAP